MTTRSLAVVARVPSDVSETLKVILTKRVPTIWEIFGPCRVILYGAD